VSAVLVLDDTHLGPGRASTLVDILGDRLDPADRIIHAGDIISLDVLEALACYAPVTAVKGNNDVDLELPSSALVQIDGHRIVVVFGHSHLPWDQQVEVAGRVQRHFNPGSPTQRRRAPTSADTFHRLHPHRRQPPAMPTRTPVSEAGPQGDPDLVCGHQPIGSPNSEQLGFSHIDGSPGTSGGSALTPHVVQIGETSPSSVSSHRSLMAPVSPPRLPDPQNRQGAGAGD